MSGLKQALESAFVVLRPDQGATLVPVTPTVYEELDRRFDGFKGHWLVSLHAFDRDWSSWERHPAGDEIVCLLSGAATMVIRREGHEESAVLKAPGDYIVVPRGLWHIGRTSVPTRMLFVTPGEGTENDPA